MYKPNEAVFNGERVINMFNTTDEDYHARTSRPVRPLYNATRVLELEPLVDASIASLLRRLDARFAAPGRVCDFADWAAWFGWDTMFHITYGEPLGFMETEGDLVDFIKGATEGQYYFSAVSQAPWLDRFLDKNPMVRIGPRPITTAIGTTFMMLLAYKKRLAEREKMTTTETPAASGTSRVETFVDKFLALQHSHPDVVDDEQVFQYSLFNMLAGGDSTASILRAAVYHLAKNPTVRATLQAELDAAAAAAAHSEAETDGYGVPAYRDVAALPYLGAVMHELMRVTPGVSQTLERVVPPAGLVLPDGRCVPGGTRVGISPAVTCKDAGVFGPEDPLAFRPERWLRRAGEADEAFAARRRRMAATLDFVFGAGKRICMGKNLATMELYKTVAALYAAFDVSSCSLVLLGVGAEREQTMLLTRC